MRSENTTIKKLLLRSSLETPLSLDLVSTNFKIVLGLLGPLLLLFVYNSSANPVRCSKELHGNPITRVTVPDIRLD